MQIQNVNAVTQIFNWKPVANICPFAVGWGVTDSGAYFSYHAVDAKAVRSTPPAQLARESEMRERQLQAPQDKALERESHFTPPKLAKIWAMSDNLMRSLIEHEPDVLKVKHPRSEDKRTCTSKFIPISVAKTLYCRLGGDAAFMLEQHYTIQAVAKILGMSQGFVRNLFANERDVLKVVRPEEKHKQPYTKCFIPLSVIRRVRAGLRGISASWPKSA